MNLSALVKRGVNAYGPALLKTELRLGDVSIELARGRMVLRDLVIGNPEGYSPASLLTADTITVSMRPAAVFSNPLFIDSFVIERPVISYEKKGSSDNFKTLLENMNASAENARGTAEAAPAPGRRGGSRTVVIGDFYMRDASVTASVMPLVRKKITMVLPELHLRNIGQGAGASPSEIAREALGAVYQSVLVNAGPGKTMLKAAGSSAQDVGQGVKKGLEKAADGIRNLFR